MAPCPASGAAAVAALLATGCLQPQRYPCDADAQCERDGVRGVCSAGWCAYEDAACPSQLRWSPYADGEVAKTCVPPGAVGSTTDTGTGSTTHAGSSSTDAPSTETGSSSSTGQPDCATICVPGPHATAAVCDDAGVCTSTCEAPWQDCDGEPANGCEVPVGVAHQCDAEGLDPVEGCWTAWCGTSESPGAVNFGAFYCIDCVTCQEPTSGMCRWCDHDSGRWFAAGACECSIEHLGAVCGP